jgi:7,8-dihydroneopterin aldolase/epimerase/oxygenase
MKEHQSILSINEISILARIGCLKEERAQPQSVRVKVVMAFAKEPLALTSDEIDDTVCYGKVTEDIVAACTAREFNLVEHMAQVIYDVVKKRLPPQCKALVHVTKVQPPVNEITGGVTFTFGDVMGDLTAGLNR